MSILEKVKAARQTRQDNPTALDNRKKFIGMLMKDFHKPTKIRKVKCPYAKGDNVYYDESTVMTKEMYPDGEGDAISGKWDIPQFLNEYHNTRKKLPSETRAEIDCLDECESFRLMGEIVERLMDKGIHFAIFYAKGQKSFHIIIYDFYELEELSSYHREQAQLLFWKSVVSWADKYLDKGMWQDEHEVPLEFAPHWKYGTIFDLVYEHLPTKRNEVQNVLFKSKKEVHHQKELIPSELSQARTRLQELTKRTNFKHLEGFNFGSLIAGLSYYYNGFEKDDLVNEIKLLEEKCKL